MPPEIKPPFTGACEQDMTSSMMQQLNRNTHSSPQSGHKEGYKNMIIKLIAN